MRGSTLAFFFLLLGVGGGAWGEVGGFNEDGSHLPKPKLPTTETQSGWKQNKPTGKEAGGMRRWETCVMNK